eukprot:scaffold18285_cov35-Tisochrysis_lutea.AAC.6
MPRHPLRSRVSTSQSTPITAQYTVFLRNCLRRHEIYERFSFWSIRGARTSLYSTRLGSPMETRYSEPAPDGSHKYTCLKSSFGQKLGSYSDMRANHL